MADIDVSQFPGLQTAFEHAGIADDKTQDVNTGDSTDGNVQESTDDKTQAKDDTKKQDDTSKPAGKDAGSSGDGDGKDKQGKEAEGQGADPADDAAQLDLVRRKKRVNPEVSERWLKQRDTAREQNADTNRRLSEAQAELQNAKQQLDTYKTAASAVGTENPVEIQHAVKLYKDFTANPLGTLTSLVAELKAKGYSVESIGGAVDQRALSLMLDERLGSKQQQQQQVPDAATEVQNFFGRYPDARMHENLLADIITKNPTLTLEKAYWDLKNAVANRGLDWNRDIRAQMQGTGGQQQQQQGQQRQQPRVDGRVDTSGVVDHSKSNTPSDGGTWDDIIRGAVKESRTN